jgi:hypothetical protein
MHALPLPRSGIQPAWVARLDLRPATGRWKIHPGAAAKGRAEPRQLVAVYSDHMAPVAIIRRILLRMKAWMNYVI